MELMKRIQYLLLGSLLYAATACEEEEPANYAPTVTTGQATDVYRKGAFLSGSIQNPNGAAIKEYGIMVSEFESMAEPTEYRMMNSQSLQTFTLEAAGLTPKKEYFYCAYASSGASTVKGQVKSFATPESNAPVFGEVKLSGLGAQSVTVASLIQDDGGSDILMHGFCWKLVGENEDAPTVKDNVVNVEIGPKEISATVSGLMPEQEYLVCPYGVNSSGVGYGRTVKFSTQSASAPVLTDIQAVDSTDLSYTVKAVIGDKGKSTITRIGFCWSAENKLPTVEDLHCELPEQLGASTFQYTIDTLSYMTTYYIRAYAENEHGVSYSDVLEFTTKEATLSFIQKEVSDITGRSAHLQTEVILEGETAPQRVGYCVSMEQLDDLTLETTKFFVDAIWNENQIECRIVGLASETQYFVRPFFVNALEKVYYGEMQTFTTGPQGIYNLEDLMAFRDARNAGESVSLWKNSEGVINIYADIDMGGVTTWTAINTIESTEVIEGNGHTINNFNLNLDIAKHYGNPELISGYYGLFLENGGTINNLVIEGDISFSLSGTNEYSLNIQFGAFCGSNNETGVINNCTFKGSVSDKLSPQDEPYTYIAGICGYNRGGSIVGCNNYGMISGGHYASGICGNNSSGTISDCNNYGTIASIEHDNSVSGILTENNGTSAVVLRCHNYGKIAGKNGHSSGICYLNGGGATIDCCVNDAEVYGTNNSGGISYFNSGVIKDCINKDKVFGNLAGGIVCIGAGEISNCGSETDITGGYLAGGIVADCWYESHIDSCTYQGNIKGKYAGGLIGHVEEGVNVTYVNCTYGGTVNGAPGTEANAIGYDARYE